MPLFDRLATVQQPASSVVLPALAGGGLAPASASALRSAATLATEALRLEDRSAELLAPSTVERTLFRLDLALLGRDIDGLRGLHEILPTAQQAIAGLLFH